MKSKFIMTAMATLLAFQVAVADEGQPSKDEKNLQHKLSKSHADVKKTKSNTIYKGPRAAVHAAVDFQFAIPGNQDQYKNSIGGNYLERGYKSDVLATKSFEISDVKKDHDGGILNDYSEKRYYSTNVMFGMTLEQVIAENMSVGASLEIAAPVSGYRHRHFASSAANKGSYVFLKSPYFTLNAGYVPGAEQALKIDTKSFSAADGGVAGNWIEYANLEGSTASVSKSPASLHRDAARPFHMIPALYSQYHGMLTSKISENLGDIMSSNDVGIAPKLALYSHEMYGMKVGVSYAPNYNDYSRNAEIYKKAGLHQFEHIVGFGVSYKKEVSNFAIHLATAGEIGKAMKENNNEPTYHDLFSMSGGGVVKYHDMISVGGEYGYLGKSGLDKSLVTDSTLDQTALSAVTPDNSRYWVLMAAYEMGPAKVSANYFNSYANPYSTDADKDGSTMSDINVGVSYNITHACRKTQFTPYLSYHQFNTKENHFVKNNADNNSGYVVMTGLKAQF